MEFDKAPVAEPMAEVDEAPVAEHMAVDVSSDTFVTRVGGYPVVASTLGHVWNFYSRCKSSHELVKASLETAEYGVMYVSNTAAPVIGKFEKPLSSVNGVACTQLDNLEKRYPIITKPTDEVVAESKKLYEENLKPSVDRVSGLGQYANNKYTTAKDYSMGKVSDVTNYSSGKIGMVRDRSYETLNMVKDKSYDQLHTVLASPTAQTIADKVDVALTVAEKYVDKYLPEKTDLEKPDPEKPVGELDKVDEMDAVQARHMIVYEKARQRLYKRALSKLHDVQARSKETIDRLNFTVSLIDYAKANMDSLNTKVSGSYQAIQGKGAFWWDEIRKDEDADEDTDVNAPQTLEMQTIKVARNLTRRLRQSLYSLNTLAIPDEMMNRINAAKEYSTELASSFMKATKMDDLSDVVMTRAKDQVAYIQETVSYMGDVAVNTWPLNRVMNIKIKELDPTEPEELSETKKLDPTEPEELSEPKDE